MSDWSSDVCSSELGRRQPLQHPPQVLLDGRRRDAQQFGDLAMRSAGEAVEMENLAASRRQAGDDQAQVGEPGARESVPFGREGEIGGASCRERGGQYV